MIGLDTNVLVRYVAQDDPLQSAKATQLIESLTAASPGLSPWCQLVWVLQSCYQSTRADIIVVLETLLRTQELTVENAEIVWQALRRFSEAKADFTDCLIERSANAAGSDYTVTFDTKAAKIAGMRSLARASNS